MTQDNQNIDRHKIENENLCRAIYIALQYPDMDEEKLESIISRHTTIIRTNARNENTDESMAESSLA